jgi:hypothetical protein
MIRLVSLSLVVLAVFSGCKQPAVTPPSRTPVPELTTESIAAEMRQALVPMTSLVVSTPGVVGWGESGRGAPALLTDEARDQVLSYLRDAKAKYGGTEQGKAAGDQISADLDALIKEAWDEERWRVVMAGINAYEILNPGSLKMARLRERAELRKNRPEVVVKGFIEDNEKKDVYAFLEVTLHPSNEVRHVQVRKGEEFCGLRLVDFIGKLKGVILEYLDIPGETFRAFGP